MKELKIIIACQAATGKSTMMVVLQQILQEKGFNVEIEYDEDINELFRQHVGERELSFMKDTKITLCQKQLKRDYTENKSIKIS